MSFQTQSFEEARSHFKKDCGVDALYIASHMNRISVSVINAIAVTHSLTAEIDLVSHEKEHLINQIRPASDPG